MFVSQ